MSMLYLRLMRKGPDVATWTRGLRGDADSSTRLRHDFTSASNGKDTFTFTFTGPKLSARKEVLERAIQPCIGFYTSMESFNPFVP